MSLPLDQRPVMVALAGPNGAGKTTFYYAHLQPAGLRFVNADMLAQQLHIEPYAAARVADSVRRELVKQRESFVFETVFSDPVGEKLAFLQSAAQAGYKTILCFVGTAGPEVPRVLANLEASLRELPNVWVFDNNDLRTPYRLVAIFDSGRLVKLQRPVPRWLRPLLPKG
jgi:predicted ABC-type ATPase